MSSRDACVVGYDNLFRPSAAIRSLVISSLSEAINVPVALGEQLQLQDPPRLRRQVSNENMKSGLGTGPGGRRSFVRFWAMVEPKAWHQ